MNAAHPVRPEVFAYTDDTCRAVAEEMTTTGVTSMPVLDRETGRIRRNISPQNLLVGRRRAVARELDRNSTFQREPRLES
jgi:CIC family chloride channel protein